jgi:hypothetical protein
MALTVTFTTNGNKVAVAETGDVTRNYTLKPEYNVFPHPYKTDRVIITDNATTAGNDSESHEYRIGDIQGAPGEQNSAVTYLTTNFFKGYTVADLSVDTIEVNNTDVENLLKGIGGTQRTPAYSRETADGSVTAGKFKAQFYNLGPDTCTVAGTNLLINEEVSFEVRDADTLAAIAYTVPVGSTLIVTTIE